MKNQIPVYLFIGFLEGGKTHMIQESMEDERFNSGEKTMIISCEEGIDEYDISRFWGKNVYIENIENESDLNLETLNNIANKHIIEIHSSDFLKILIRRAGLYILAFCFVLLMIALHNF